MLIEPVERFDLSDALCVFFFHVDVSLVTNFLILLLEKLDDHATDCTFLDFALGGLIFCTRFFFFRVSI